MFSKDYLYNQIRKLHKAASDASRVSAEEYAYNKAYNQYVTNNKLPETFGEFLEKYMYSTDVEISIIDGYLELCWEEDQFFYPSYDMMYSLLLKKEQTA